MESTCDKKKPGRPKKTIANTPQQFYGIVNEPQMEGNVVELVYYNPSMFKKLFILQKSFSVSEVELYFTPTQMQIITIDHLKKSHIYITIEGKYMNLYYCKAPIRICVKLDALDKCMRTLTKSHTKITFILGNDYRSSLYVIFKDEEYKSADTYELDVIFRPEEAVLTPQDDSEYPLRFKLDAKHFKSRINGIRKSSETFTIGKIKDKPLTLHYDEPASMSWVGSYDCPEKIELKSTLSPDDILSVNIMIDYIKPFSNSNIANDVYIAVDKRKPISFLSYLDMQSNGEYVCTLKIFTEIASSAVYLVN